MLNHSYMNSVCEMKWSCAPKSPCFFLYDLQRRLVSQIRKLHVAQPRGCHGAMKDKAHWGFVDLEVRRREATVLKDVLPLLYSPVVCKDLSSNLLKITR